MQIVFSGSNPFFLTTVFFDHSLDIAYVASSEAPHEIVLSNPFANAEITLFGTDLNVNEAGELNGGSITQMAVRQDGQEEAVVSNILWSASDFHAGLEAISRDYNFEPLAKLFETNGPIIIDATDGLVPYDQEQVWRKLIPFLDVPFEFLGTDFGDEFKGTDGDDLVDMGTSLSSREDIIGSLGDDTIIFTRSLSSSSTLLDYSALQSSLTFDIDGNQNEGAITGGGFVDTLVDIEKAIDYGLFLTGADESDVFNVVPTENGTIYMRGGRGSDTYNIGLDGVSTRIFFSHRDQESGLALDLATGFVSDDGLGFRDQINITSGKDNLFIGGTALNDVITGGRDGKDSLFLGLGDDRATGGGGDDTISGGGGIDVSVYSGSSHSYTLQSNRGITTIIDRRADGDGEDLLISVEYLAFEEGVDEFDLSKFHLATYLTGEELEDLISLYIAYFNRAPDALGLSFWGTAFANGTSFEEIASLFEGQEEVQQNYPDTQSVGRFISKVYDNVLGRIPDVSGFEFWSEMMDTGTITRDQFILELLLGVKEIAHSSSDQMFLEQQQADRDYLATKTDIGAYFAIHKGMSDTGNAATAMALFDGTLESVSAATSQVDDFYSDALDPLSGEFLMPLIGVLDDPFLAG